MHVWICATECQFSNRLWWITISHQHWASQRFESMLLIHSITSCLSYTYRTSHTCMFFFKKNTCTNYHTKVLFLWYLIGVFHMFVFRKVMFVSAWITCTLLIKCIYNLIVFEIESNVQLRGFLSVKRGKINVIDQCLDYCHSIPRQSEGSCTGLAVNQNRPVWYTGYTKGLTNT